MELQTKLHIPNNQGSISYESQLFLWGSCFSVHIGERFKKAQFRSDSNPFGIIFNPMAMAPLFERMASGLYFRPSDFFESHEQWHSYSFHSQLSKSSVSEALEAANQALFESIEFIKSSSHLIITLGTAWGYLLLDSSTKPPLSSPYTSNSEVWVANCHKQPATEFEKKMATQAQLKDALKRIRQAVQQLNPQIHLLFTVSPVRHLKDGLQENSRSKAALLTAVHDFIESENLSTPQPISYFPAYEIQMDELRDYRFYATDMAHPSEQAVDYIWERFKAATMTSECLNFMKRVYKVQRDMNHRPFQECSKAHQAFKAKVAQEVIAVQKIFPWMFN